MTHYVYQTPIAEDQGPFYTSVQEALSCAKTGDTILIGPGTYYEKIRITINGLTIRGQGPDQTFLTFDDYALKPYDDSTTTGTFRSYSLLVMADDITIENLCIKNEAGDGRQVGQAVALYTEGNHNIFRNLVLTAYQDTVFTGPLPESPNIPGSFVGPSENKPYRQCLQYFENCLIKGDVDYIFGSSLTVFFRCDLVTRNRHMDINGYVTAPSTWAGEPYGYVFVACQFRGEPGTMAGSVFFGRPWRPYGQVALVACRYDATIHPDRWDHWGKESNKETCQFSEYDTKAFGQTEESFSQDLQRFKQSSFIRRSRGTAYLEKLLPWHKQFIRGDESLL